jgi:hypothetical protein
MSPEAVVQRQLEAYNARDLARFLACFSERIEVYRPPEVEPVMVGKATFGAFYAGQRFNREGLHAELLDRIVLGTRVIDHERIVGVGERALELAVVYAVAEGLIQTMHVFAAD